MERDKETTLFALDYLEQEDTCQPNTLLYLRLLISQQQPKWRQEVERMLEKWLLRPELLRMKESVLILEHALDNGLDLRHVCLKYLALGSGSHLLKRLDCHLERDPEMAAIYGLRPDWIPSPLDRHWILHQSVPVLLKDPLLLDSHLSLMSWLVMQFPDQSLEQEDIEDLLERWIQVILTAPSQQLSKTANALFTRFFELYSNRLRFHVINEMLVSGLEPAQMRSIDLLRLEINRNPWFSLEMLRETVFDLLFDLKSTLYKNDVQFKTLTLNDPDLFFDRANFMHSVMNLLGYLMLRGNCYLNEPNHLLGLQIRFLNPIRSSMDKMKEAARENMTYLTSLSLLEMTFDRFHPVFYPTVAPDA
ncbi:hypothetical protein EDD86DRAFT_248036 [Gorgonomyces haynaldii]|nr:hypothetical protein EDD86DRAFT_248036 [Gorgonomyces haynaldii]